LTFLPEENREKILNNIELKPITPKTVTDMEVLRQQLDMFSEMGYSIDDEENEEGLICLAAPIFGGERKVRAAISVAGPKERMLKHKEHIVEKLLETSKKITKSIGYL
jgi:DNA-binding IclR family transcriptional regulator